MIDAVQVRESLLRNELIIFASDYGKKAIAESWTVRLSKQVKKLDQFKEFENYNIATGGDSLVVDIDLDCSEALQLADYFIPSTQLEFGRASTPRSHRLLKVIDLNKKHTRTFWDFKGDEKSMLVELRANKHYTMAMGQYDNGEKVVWNTVGQPTEINWDTLTKSAALLSVACVVMRKYPGATSKMRNEYLKLMIAALWQHKVEKEDCIKIIKAVAKVEKDNVEERLARVEDIYKRERTEQIQGLPKLAEQFNWSEDEVKDFKKLLYKITGRDDLPEFTHEFVKRIAYMMKQKRYYDLEDKEMYEGESIDIKYAYRFNGKYTPLKFWKLHKDRKVCVDFTYKPADQNRFVHVDKKLMINVYEKHDLQPNPKADTDLFDALVKEIIPHDDCRNHFLDWYAFPLQNAGVKIRHAIIMQSDEYQLGKGSLFDLHRNILGKHNTNKIDLQQAINRERSFLVDKQTVLIDEAKASGSWTEKAMFINTLKTLISEGTAGIRQLYKGYNEQDTITNYWINTNYRDAFPLPYNEVRYWVYFSDAKRNERLLTEFHQERLHGDLAAGVMAQLMDRDLSKFDPLGVAPWTPYRDEMSKLADKPLNDYVKESFEQGIFPLDRSLVTATELFHYWKDKTKIKFSRERDVAAALKLIGGTRVRGCPVDDVGATVNIWVIRDHDKYKGITAKVLGKKYQGFYTDSRTTRAVNKRSKPIDKALVPGSTVSLQNATKAGEKDVVKNTNEYNNELIDQGHDEF